MCGRVLPARIMDQDTWDLLDFDVPSSVCSEPIRRLAIYCHAMEVQVCRLKRRHVSAGAGDGEVLRTMLQNTLSVWGKCLIHSHAQPKTPEDVVVHTLIVAVLHQRKSDINNCIRWLRALEHNGSEQVDS